jgi:hypothetical protein
MSKNADLKKTDLKLEQSEPGVSYHLMYFDLPFHTDIMEEYCLEKVRIEVNREVTVDLPSLL